MLASRVRVQSPQCFWVRVCLSSSRALKSRPIAAMARDVWLVPSSVPILVAYLSTWNICMFLPACQFRRIVDPAPTAPTPPSGRATLSRAGVTTVAAATARAFLSTSALLIVSPCV